MVAIKEEAPLITGTHNAGETGGTTSTISRIRTILSVKQKLAVGTGRKFSFSEENVGTMQQELYQLRQQKRQQYAEHGQTLESDADVDSEIVASYIAKNLLTSEQEITSLARNQVPSELYKNTAGEIEARDTADRRRLDAEGRKNHLPIWETRIRCLWT